MAGPCSGATGALENSWLVFALWRRDMVPPTINFKEEDPAIDYKPEFHVQSKLRREKYKCYFQYFWIGAPQRQLVDKKSGIMHVLPAYG